MRAVFRVAYRTAGVAGITLGDLAGMELARLASPRDESEAVTRRWMRLYGRQILRLLGGRVETGLPKGDYLPGRDASGKGRIFVMNHRSMLDIYVYLAHVEAFALSRGDLANWPIIGAAARRVGTVFVDRESKSSGRAAVAAMSEAVRNGKGVLVFPEGTTFAGDEVQPFRAGAFVAAARTKAQIVPLGVAYEREDACFVEDSFLEHWKKLGGMKVVRLALEHGEPIAPGDPEETRKMAHEAVQALVHQARARLNGTARAE
ncbi:MAG: lysophospholipid acyltransferase family protein [Myxococcales bacterium]